MSKIQELAHQLEQEYAGLLEEVRKEKESVARDRQTLNKKKTSLDEVEGKLSIREAEVLKREAEVEQRYSKIRNDDEVMAQYNQNLKLKEENDKAKKDIKDLIAEKDFRIGEIHKMELALSEEKKTYKEKIKADVQEELRKLIK